MIQFNSFGRANAMAGRGAAQQRPRANRRRGAIMAMVLVMLPVLFIFAAFAINLAHIESTNTDIQITCDAAARAAGQVYAVTGDRNQALAAAREAAEENPIGQSAVLSIADEDLVIGESFRAHQNTTYDFTPSHGGNSIRISTQSLANGHGVAVKPLLPIFGLQKEIRPFRSAISTQSDIDIALVIDRSGSMAYAANEPAAYPPAPAAAAAGWDFGDPVPPKSRWLDLVAAVEVFITTIDESAQDELVSLSVYNEENETLLDLTNQHNQILGSLDDISYQFHKGGTNIGGGMWRGAKTLTDASYTRNASAKVMIVLTDGVHNVGWKPVKAAERIAAEGITVFTITFSEEANQEDMQKVAEICGGRHFHATTALGLKHAFVDIAKYLPSLITE